MYTVNMGYSWVLNTWMYIKIGMRQGKQREMCIQLKC